jgi:hypothetical protein
MEGRIVVTAYSNATRSRPHLLSNESAMVSYLVTMGPNGYYERVLEGAVIPILL